MEVNATAIEDVEIKPDDVGPDDPAALAVQAALADGVRRLVEHEPGARRGDVDGVHKMRTSARRLRGALRTFGPLLDEGWTEGVMDELRWISHALGEVRDLDVLRDRLGESAGELSGALGPLFEALHQRHDQASASLRDALRGDRYRDLLRRLTEAAHGPATTEAADAPSREALPPLVADAWKSLARRARALELDSPDEDFHEARKRAKRARYAAEAVAPALGNADRKDAERFARRATDLQDLLGEHQDAVVAGQEVERVASGRGWDGPFNLAAGRLLERQARAARESREAFPAAWDEIDRRKIRRWMRP